MADEVQSSYEDSKPTVGNLQLATNLNPGYYGLLPLRGPGRFSAVHALDKCSPGNYGLTTASAKEILGAELPSHLSERQINAILSLVSKYGPDAMTLIEEIIGGLK